jgi:hypothetical protein
MIEQIQGYLSEAFRFRKEEQSTGVKLNEIGKDMGKEKAESGVKEIGKDGHTKKAYILYKVERL